MTAVAPKSGDDAQVVLTTAAATYTIRANDFARVLQANLPSAGTSRPYASNSWVGYLLAAAANAGVTIATSMASAARFIDN